MAAALAPMVDDLLSDADAAGRLDFIIQKALFAVRYGGVRPELTDRDLELTDMVNPELCDLLAEQGRRFVPVSITLIPGATVITGANMGGKSRGHEDRGPQRPAAPGRLPGLCQKGPDAPVPQRENALR